MVTMPIRLSVLGRVLPVGFSLMVVSFLGCSREQSSATSAISTIAVPVTSNQIFDFMKANPVTAASIASSGARTFNELYKIQLVRSYQSLILDGVNLPNLHERLVASEQLYQTLDSTYANVKAFWVANNLTPTVQAVTLANVQHQSRAVIQNLSGKTALGLTDHSTTTFTSGANDPTFAGILAQDEKDKQDFAKAHPEAAAGAKDDPNYKAGCDSLNGSEWSCLQQAGYVNANGEGDADKSGYFTQRDTCGFQTVQTCRKALKYFGRQE